MTEWIPKKICSMDEFLSPELKELRDYVLKTREEDISVKLHVYEERVLFSSYGFKASRKLEEIISQEKTFKNIDFYGDKNELIGWETIRTFQHDITNGEAREFTTEKRKAKQYFLKGWMEVRLWDRGLHTEQKIYPVPEHPENIGFSHEKKDRFFYGEYIRFSIDLARRYWDIYIRLKPWERPKKPRLVNKNQSVAKENAWNVFVTSDLRQYYYDANDDIKHRQSAEFYPVPEKMETINCLKKNETLHAAIGNYDSWQTFLHALHTQEGKIMTSENTLSGKIRKLQDEADHDHTLISDDIKTILRKIATETRLCELCQKDLGKITKASEVSPKIRLLLRMAQLKYIRLKTAEHLALEAVADKKQENEKTFNIQNLGYAMIISISEAWTPKWAGQPVTASDIPVQNHSLRMDRGNINISCYWRGQYKNTPAFIRVSWKADITTPGILLARFMNPETQKIHSELRLGTHLAGEKTFTSEDLGFDPSNEIWSVSIILAEKK